MFRHRLAVSRIPHEGSDESAFPDCEYPMITGDFIILEPNQEICTKDGYFIASNNTNYEVAAKFYSPETEKYSEPVTVNKPLAVSYNISTSRVYSKIKCLDTSSGCKLQIVEFYPSEIGHSEESVENNVYISDSKVLSYFSTKASGSYSQKVKHNYEIKKDGDLSLIHI